MSSYEPAEKQAPPPQQASGASFQQAGMAHLHRHLVTAGNSLLAGVAVYLGWDGDGGTVTEGGQKHSCRALQLTGSPWLGPIRHQSQYPQPSCSEKHPWRSQQPNPPEW